MPQKRERRTTGAPRSRMASGRQPTPSAAAFGGQEAAALGNLSRGVGQASRAVDIQGDRLYQMQEKKARLWEAESIAKLRGHFSDMADRGELGSPEEFQKKFFEATDEYIKKAPNNDSALRMKASLTSMGNAFVNASKREIAAAAAAKTETQMINVVGEIERGLMQLSKGSYVGAPITEEYIEEQLQSFEGQGIASDKIARQVNAFKSKLLSIELSQQYHTAASSDPKATVEIARQLKENHGIDINNPINEQQAIRDFDNLKNLYIKGDAVSDEQFEEVRDRWVSSQLNSTGSNYDAKLAQADMQIRDTKFAGDVYLRLGTLTNKQLAATDTYTAEPKVLDDLAGKDIRDREIAFQYVQNEKKLRAANPAAVAIRNSATVLTAYEDAFNMATGDGEKDVAQIELALSAVVSEQVKLGVKIPRPLLSEHASQLVNKYAGEIMVSGEKSVPMRNTTKIIKDLKNKFGSQATPVFKQLMEFSKMSQMLDYKTAFTELDKRGKSEWDAESYIDLNMGSGE